MISRIWHGWTTPENADNYEALLREEILGIQSRGIPGFCKIQLLRRPLQTEVEFVTIWNSIPWTRYASLQAKTMNLRWCLQRLAHFDAGSHHYEIKIAAH
jgi:hypothetical protein